MIARAVFILVTFALVWLLQAVSLYLLPAALPMPHWPLLVVLAIGGAGRTNLAQGLGFFWGLAMDLYGQTPFGAQAWALALAGYVAGGLSKKLNAQKVITQEALALGGTVSVLFLVSRLTEWFIPASGPRPLGFGLWAGALLLNAMAAPGVFWALRHWLFLSDARAGRAVARD